MDSEDISAPKPIFPTGSTVTSTIPLLEDDSAAVADAAAPMVIPDTTTDLPTTESAPLADETTSASTPPATATAPVTANDDAVAQSAQTSSDAQPDHSSTSKIESAATDQVPLATSAEPDTSAPTQEPSPSLPMALPAGVDLQALLNSFASSAQTESSAAPPASVVSQPAPAVSEQPAPASVPVVPWQAQQPMRVPTGPSNPAGGNAPSDDAAYEQFLVDEKRIMGNTAPHEFEPGSRLFVGNLSNDTTSKREIFMIFRKYGKLAQVSLKSTYGFVQYLTARECRTAMEREQNLDVGGRKLHLEISKPQTPRGGGGGGGGGAGANAIPTQPRRRSRSPARRSESRGYGRDPYDPYGRSPPPRRHSPGRFHTPYDAPAYPGRSTPSQRPYQPPADELPLPPRYGAQIPEAQIVVLDEADRTYIYWVETSIRQAGIKVETLFLSPRLGLPAVVRQMAKEGVLAIVQCDRQLQMTNKVSLQVFDRSTGANNVRFDEYAGLDMSTAIGLLRRSQQQQQVLAAAMPQVGSAAAAAPAAPPGQANLAAMIAQMDPASLQQVIGALSQQQQQQSQAYPGSYPYRR